MAKKRTTKKKKKSSNENSFIDTLFSLIIIGAVLYGGYYFFFRDNDSFDKKINEIKDKVEEVTEEVIIDNKETEEPVEDDIIPPEEDDMNMQFEDEIIEQVDTDADTVMFETTVDKYSNRYTGLRLSEGKDPDSDNATDNSHLICKIISHAAERSGMYFKGYMPMAMIRKNIHKVSVNEIRNGDLIKLKNGMLALITDRRSSDDFKIIYASESKNSVVITPYDQLKYYWLKPDNFDGYYRFNESVLH